jgi:hypothetical protein
MDISKIQRIMCIRKVDTFKSNWYLWEAEAEMKDGSIIEGFVQADYQGEMIAYETFEPEE